MTIEEVEKVAQAFHDFVENKHRGVLHPYQVKEFVEEIKQKQIKKDDTIKQQ